MATMVVIPSPFEALQSAVECAGSQAELARLVGVSSTAVWKWVNIARRVPAEFALRVERATGISRNWLRPDIYPIERRRVRKAVGA